MEQSHIQSGCDHSGGDVEQKVKNVLSLRPTQMTVGMREVLFKRDELVHLMFPHIARSFNYLRYDGRVPEHIFRINAFLQKHVVPVILGPHGAMYIQDHHHLCYAANMVGIPNVYIEVRQDLSDAEDFWDAMRGLIHPIDSNGVCHTADMLPGSVTGLRDDQYRSLAWMARKSGAFEKTDRPFHEFEWADYFRRSIPIEIVERDFECAANLAIALAEHAEHLPGHKNKHKR